MKDSKEENRKIRSLISLMLLLIVTIISYAWTKNVIVMFVANLCIMLMTIIKAKFSYFTIKNIIFNYLIFSLFSQYVFGSSYGILEHTNMPIHYLEMAVIMLLYNSIMYLFITITHVLEKEKKLLTQEIIISNKSAYICSAIAIICTFIAMPTIPFLQSGERFQALLPGNAWNHIAIVALLLAFPKLKKNHVVQFAYGFVIIWFLAHLERVDIIGLIIGVLLLLAAQKDKIPFKKIAIAGFVLLIIAVGMIWIGESRIGAKSSFSIQNIARKVFVQSTAADVAFSYNCAIDYYETKPIYWGSTYLKYIIEILPFMDSSNYEVGSILQKQYGTPGGNFILNEPLMNLGIFGVLIYAVVELYLYDKLLSKQNKFRYFVYAFLIWTTFRTNWYGWMFIEKALIYFIPILYFIVNQIDKKEARKQKKIKNVIIYSEKWTTGGIEAFIMNVYRHMDKENLKINIMCSENDTDLYDEELKTVGTEKIVTLNKKYASPIKRMLMNIIGFTRKIVVSDCDILHLNICNGVALYYAFIAKCIGIDKIIIHSHNTDVGNDSKSIKILGHKIGKKLFLWCGSDYLACSDLAAKWLFTQKQIEEGKVKIINNGIDVQKFTFNKEKRQEVRDILNLDKDTLVVGHIGRFGEQKNHMFLIDIFKEIYEKEKNTILLLVGNGELEDTIKQRVKELNLEKQVIFYGITNRTDKCFDAMDVFVLPSLFEGNPVVGVEAQTSGIKCFFADTITKKAQITDLVTFIPLEVGAEKWAEVILENKEYERKEQMENIKQAGYDIENISKTLKEIYVH